ncbi:MAG: hypothetical protein AB1696_00670 [Planctomycetota bacterium]
MADVEIIPTGGRNIYRLAVAELDGNPTAGDIVGATYDNRLCAFDANGKHRWDAAAGGFVFDLAAGDLDGDGRDEIAAACADGFVRVFDAAGRLRWEHDLQAPVLQVCIARLDGKTPVVLAGGVSRQIVVLFPTGQPMRSVNLDQEIANAAVRMLRAGDFDGDGQDEVALLPIRGQAQDVRFLKGPALEPMPKTRIPLQRTEYVKTASGALEPKESNVKFRKGVFEWSGNTLKTTNGLVADVNGDGAAELLLGGWGYTLKGPDAPRRVVELPDPPKVWSYDYHYRMRFLAAGDLTEHPGNEIVVVEGPDVQLCQSDGKVIAAAHAPFGFSDVVYVPGAPHGSVILGSSPNGDDNLYRVRFGGDWKKELESLPRRGRMADIEANLRHIADAAARWQGPPMIGADGPYDVVVNHYFWNGGPDLKIVDRWIEEVRFYEKAFPYSRLRFSIAFWPGEKLPLMRPDGKEWTRDARLAHDLTREQIAAGARKLEEARCHFWVQVGHGCAPHCSVEAAAAILDAAPTMCLGFISAEDEQTDQIAYYHEHHIQPILELCLKHGKRFIPRNKALWWVYWPAEPNLRRTIFNGKYRSVLLPCVEDSNSITADAQLAARVGLWLDGQVDDWSSRCSADWFCFNRCWEWEYVMTGHPHLRYYVSQAMLGARVFMMLNGERANRSGEWTRVGLEGTANFMHLLGKGVITPPKREQLRAISPVALNIQDPSLRLEVHGANGHAEQGWNRDGTDTRPWPFDRLDCYWGMAPLPLTDVSTYLWGRTRRAAEHVAATTPHGFVCIIPGSAPRKDGPWSSVWTTDGDSLSKDGQNHSLEEARKLILADLAEGEKRLSFHVEGRVFHQVVEQAPDHYLVVLIDSGWLDPADRLVKLSARIAGRWSVTDRLNKQPIGLLNNDFSITLPAGTLQILELQQSQ